MTWVCNDCILTTYVKDSLFYLLSLDDVKVKAHTHNDRKIINDWIKSITAEAFDTVARITFIFTDRTKGHTFMMLSQMLAVCRANIDNQDRDKWHLSTNIIYFKVYNICIKCGCTLNIGSQQNSIIKSRLFMV